MSTLLKLIPIEEVLEGTPAAVHSAELGALAVFKVGDHFYVTANLCTHGQAMLSDGFQEGRIIECPFHGGAFDVTTGLPTAPPCQLPLRSYSVTIIDGFVCIDDPSAP